MAHRPRATVGDTPLHALVSYAYTDDASVASYLASPTAARDAGVRNAAGITPMHLAVSCAYFSGVELLAKCLFTDVDARDSHGRTASHIAAGLPQHALPMLQLLWRSGAHVMFGPSGALNADGQGNTPLHAAAANGNEAAVVWLVEACNGSAAIDSRTVAGDTALHLAISARDVATVSALVSFGARITARGSVGMTATELANATDAQLVGALRRLDRDRQSEFGPGGYVAEGGPYTYRRHRGYDPEAPLSGRAPERGSVTHSSTVQTLERARVAVGGCAPMNVENAAAASDAAAALCATQAYQTVDSGAIDHTCSQVRGVHVELETDVAPSALIKKESDNIADTRTATPHSSNVILMTPGVRPAASVGGSLSRASSGGGGGATGSGGARTVVVPRLMLSPPSSAPDDADIRGWNGSEQHRQLAATIAVKATALSLSPTVQHPTIALRGGSECTNAAMSATVAPLISPFAACNVPRLNAVIGEGTSDSRGACSLLQVDTSHGPMRGCDGDAGAPVHYPPLHHHSEELSAGASPATSARTPSTSARTRSPPVTPSRSARRPQQAPAKTEHGRSPATSARSGLCVQATAHVDSVSAQPAHREAAVSEFRTSVGAARAPHAGAPRDGQPPALPALSIGQALALSSSRLHVTSALLGGCPVPTSSGDGAVSATTSARLPLRSSAHVGAGGSSHSELAGLLQHTTSLAAASARSHHHPSLFGGAHNLGVAQWATRAAAPLTHGGAPSAAFDCDAANSSSSLGCTRCGSGGGGGDDVIPRGRDRSHISGTLAESASASPRWLGVAAGRAWPSGAADRGTRPVMDLRSARSAVALDMPFAAYISGELDSASNASAAPWGGGDGGGGVLSADSGQDNSARDAAFNSQVIPMNTFRAAGGGGSCGDSSSMQSASTTPSTTARSAAAPSLSLQTSATMTLPLHASTALATSATFGTAGSPLASPQLSALLSVAPPLSWRYAGIRSSGVVRDGNRQRHSSPFAATLTAALTAAVSSPDFNMKSTSGSSGDRLLHASVPRAASIARYATDDSELTSITSPTATSTGVQTVENEREPQHYAKPSHCERGPQRPCGAANCATCSPWLIQLAAVMSRVAALEVERDAAVARAFAAEKALAAQLQRVPPDGPTEVVNDERAVKSNVIPAVADMNFSTPLALSSGEDSASRIACCADAQPVPTYGGASRSDSFHDAVPATAPAHSRSSSIFDDSGGSVPRMPGDELNLNEL